MIDKTKIAIAAACEIGLLVTYMLEYDMIRASDAMDVVELISETFIRAINAYNEMEDKND